MPPTPSAASPGTAAASAESGTINSPNSAIDGTVCSSIEHGEERALQSRRRAPPRPRAESRSPAPARRDPATSAIWRPSARGEELAPGRVFAGDRQLVERPGQRQRREPRQRCATTAKSRRAGPARRRCNSSTIASAAQAAMIQNAAPSETRAAGPAAAAMVLAAVVPPRPGSRAAAVRPATPPPLCTGLRGGNSEQPAAARPAPRSRSNGAAPAALSNPIGRPETSRFGATCDEPRGRRRGCRDDDQDQQHRVAHAGRQAEGRAPGRGIGRRRHGGGCRDFR